MLPQLLPRVTQTSARLEIVQLPAAIPCARVCVWVEWLGCENAEVLFRPIAGIGTGDQTSLPVGTPPTPPMPSVFGNTFSKCPRGAGRGRGPCFGPVNG